MTTVTTNRGVVVDEDETARSARFATVVFPIAASGASCSCCPWTPCSTPSGGISLQYAP